MSPYLCDELSNPAPHHPAHLDDPAARTKDGEQGLHGSFELLASEKKPAGTQLTNPPVTRRPKMLQFFSNRLESFRKSSLRFDVLTEAPIGGGESGGQAPDGRDDAEAVHYRKPLPGHERTVVLDSSFNPPTLAHQALAVSAINRVGRPGTRLLLVLAVNNADKAAKPASFEERLVLMNELARDIREELDEDNRTRLLSAIPLFDKSAKTWKSNSWPRIAIALTTLPYFHEKSAAIALDEPVDGANTGGAEAEHFEPREQIFLVGYDTLIRIFNPRYYKASTDAASSPQRDAHTEDTPMQRALSPMFRIARLLVTVRDDGDAGLPPLAEQLAYIDRARSGDLLDEAGGRADWGKRIELAVGKQMGRTFCGDAVSSTAARQAARGEDWDRLRALVSPNVLHCVQDLRPYVDGT